jgi:hypothetical protein
MLTVRTNLVRRVTAALDASPSRIPVLLGGCGSGRTTVLQQLRERLGRSSTQYIDVERTATTPERWLHAVIAAAPFPVQEPGHAGARQSFDAALEFFSRARTGAGEPVTFLLDEFLELRTFESFPGLRRVIHEFMDAITASPCRFVLSSRYVARSMRVLRDHASRFEIIQVPPLSIEEVTDMLGPGAPASIDLHERDHLAETVAAVSGGRPTYAAAIADELTTMREHGVAGSSDAVSALAALLAANARVARQCTFCYELRLHRARGYGALKAILDILGEEENLTLTEISHRLQRTPGSTKDYLSWLEDVDLVTSDHKRYSFADPLLRVWVRLHCRATAPTDDDLAREVHRYALPRMPPIPDRTEAIKPQPDKEPAFAMAGSPSSGIIEID